MAVSKSKAAVRAISSRDRKSTRLNSSHQIISYAVFCLKKKKNEKVSVRATQVRLHRREAHQFLLLRVQPFEILSCSSRPPLIPPLLFIHLHTHNQLTIL